MLLVGTSALADDAQCRDAFNKANRNVGNQEQKANRKCIKDTVSGDATSCIDAVSAKALAKETKVEELFQAGGKCDPNAAFGVNNDGTPAGDVAAKAAEDGSDNIIRDLWGNPVDDVVPGDKCADAVAKRSGKIYDTILREFRTCNKATAPGNLAALDACVSTAIADAKVATFAGKLTQDVTNKCHASAPIVDGTDDGFCGASVTPGDLSSCALARAKCNACNAIKRFTNGNADCDSLDDGLANGSCVVPVVCGDSIVEGGEECDPPGSEVCGFGRVCGATCVCGGASHKCTFDGATDNSQLQICFLGVCTSPVAISGAADVVADPAAEDVNGKRSCQCALQTFDPVAISGVGTVCIEPAGPCPDGEVDCDGGNNLNVDVEAFAQIGACTGNADCAGQCATHCSGLGKVVDNSGCEGFCRSGTRIDQPCLCDLAGGATCSGGVAGTNDCPGGACEGKDNEADLDCHCICIDETAGPASAAGQIQCRVGIALRVEADPVCDNSGVLIRLPTQCAPFTSGTVSNIIRGANEGGTDQGPYIESGISGSCSTADTSTTTGYQLVSVLAFLDTTIGDVMARVTVDCQ